MASGEFTLAGAELPWPIGSAAGLTNYPDIEVVGRRLEGLLTTGLGFTTLGSWTVGDERGGNGYVKTDTGWDYVGGDEYLDLASGAGYNSKGLPGPGTDKGMPRIGDFVDLASAHGVELTLSLSPHAGDPQEELKEIMSLAVQALAKKVLLVEVNLSCPNIEGRPPFYKDAESLSRYYSYLDDQPVPLNKYGVPGVYLKDGPVDDVSEILGPPSGYGRVTSNTLGNKRPMLPSGRPAIKANNGNAGMSGPALERLGREQLRLRMPSLGVETISVLGVSTGREVKTRHDIGAAAVELGSVLYWPELIGCDSAGESVEKIKQEFVDIA